jgi:hypothetical protein
MVPARYPNLWIERAGMTIATCRRAETSSLASAFCDGMAGALLDDELRVCDASRRAIAHAAVDLSIAVVKTFAVMRR